MYVYVLYYCFIVVYLAAAWLEWTDVSNGAAAGEAKAQRKQGPYLVKRRRWHGWSGRQGPGWAEVGGVCVGTGTCAYDVPRWNPPPPLVLARSCEA